MIPNDLKYHFPYALYCVLAAPFILILFMRLQGYRRKTVGLFAEKELLASVLMPRASYNFWTKTAAYCFAWVFATLALMQPKGNGRYPLEEGSQTAASVRGEEKEAIVQRKAHDVVFLLDASGSMETMDTRTGAARLAFAKEIVDEAISRLRGESVALYAFTSDTTKLSPPTMDYVFVRLMLRDMRINEGDLFGTNLLEAVSDMRAFHFKDRTPKLKTLVILTDGGDTRLEELEGAQREKRIDEMLSLLDDAEENNLRVFTIGMGTGEGKEIPNVLYQGKPVRSSLDEDLLRRISEKGRGSYYFADNWTALNLAEELTRKMGEVKGGLEEYKVKSGLSPVKGEEDLVYDLFFQIPLGLALLFLAIAVFLPDTTRLKRAEP